jgi:glycerol-3-phosphate acyltransferase PlsY
MLANIAYLIFAYLFGSISSAIIICRILSLPDPRFEGSKNPGATNVLRLGGVKIAVIVLILDMLKGFIPVFLAKLLGASPVLLSLICLSAVLGHMFPVFFQFKGGKGVATAGGAFFGISGVLGTLAFGTWLIVASISKYSSLASLVTLALAPFYALYMTHNTSVFSVIAVISIFILYKHHENITRLVDGTEKKIQLKSSKK